MRIANRTRKSDVLQRKTIERVARVASNNAVKNALNNGRSITIQQGEAIVKVHPDGSYDVIRKLEKSSVIPEKRRYLL
jgi:hypothetical protein